MRQLLDHYCRQTKLHPALSCPVLATIILVCSALAVHAAEPKGTQTVIAAFNDYKQKNYTATINKMTQVLTDHPNTLLRDMALFWLARANYKKGNHRDAARYLSQFKQEYPDHNLMPTVNDELLDLVARYEQGELLVTNASPEEMELVTKKNFERIAEEKFDAALRAAEETLALEKAEATHQAAEEKRAREKAEAERRAAEQLAAAKAAEERAQAERADLERRAEVKAIEMEEAFRAAIEKAEAEERAIEEAAAAKLAAAKAAAEKAEAERLAAEQPPPIDTDQEKTKPERH